MMTDQMQALIVEDNPNLSVLFSEALRESGFMIEAVFDGKEAEQRLKEIVPHLILLDLHLPGVSGVDLLVQIRQDPRLKETFVIVASADGTWAGHISEQADLVMNKPVSFIQLRDLGGRIYQNLSRE